MESDSDDEAGEAAQAWSEVVDAVRGTTHAPPAGHARAFKIDPIGVRTPQTRTRTE
jgi:hypothetical protein